MDETRHRRQSIAKEVSSWGIELPLLRSRIAAALAKASVTGKQKIDLEVIARRITMLFNAIGEMPGADEADAVIYDRLVQRTDRLRELIGAVNASLEDVARLPPDAVPHRATPRDWKRFSR
jgi:hypothetical protein